MVWTPELQKPSLETPLPRLVRKCFLEEQLSQSELGLPGRGNRMGRGRGPIAALGSHISAITTKSYGVLTGASFLDLNYLTDSSEQLHKVVRNTVLLLLVRKWRLKETALSLAYRRAQPGF